MYQGMEHNEMSWNLRQKHLQCTDDNVDTNKSCNLHLQCSHIAHLYEKQSGKKLLV